MTFFIEQQIKVTGTFRDVEGHLVDPTVTAFLRDPHGNSASMSVSRDSQGVYSFYFVPPRSGQYWYRWESTGIVRAAYEGSVDIAPSKFEA